MSVLVYNQVRMGLLATQWYVAEEIPNGPDMAGIRHTACFRVVGGRNCLGPVDTGAGILAAVIGDLAGAALLGGGAILGAAANLEKLKAIPRIPIGQLRPGPGVNGLNEFIRVHSPLLEPRKRLTYVLGNTVVVDVPEETTAPPPPPVLVAGGARPPAAPAITRAATDIELGPWPLSVKVIRFVSEQQVEFLYTIQWSTAPCPNEKLPYLSHIWSAKEDIDVDYFAVRTYVGRVRLDPRIRGAAGTHHPDKMRGVILPPLTRGFQRQEVHVFLAEDGVTLDYVVVDRQPHQYVNSANISRIVGTASMKAVHPTLLERAQAWSGALKDIGSLGSIDRFFGNIVTGAGLLTSAYGALTYQIIPYNIVAIDVTAHGTPNATYADMDHACRLVFLWRFWKNIAMEHNEIWGGSIEMIHSSEPKTSTLKANLILPQRYPFLYYNDGQTFSPSNAEWHFGRFNIRQWRQLDRPGGDEGSMTEPLPIEERQDNKPLFDWIQITRDAFNIFGRFTGLLGEDNAPPEFRVFEFGPPLEVPQAIRHMLFSSRIALDERGFMTNFEARQTWGWDSRDFAAGLLSGRDAQVRNRMRYSIRRPDGAQTTAAQGGMAALFIAGLQDICKEKEIAQLNDAEIEAVLRGGPGPGPGRPLAPQRPGGGGNNLQAIVGGM